MEETKTINSRKRVPEGRIGKDEMNLVEFPFAVLSDRAIGINTLTFSDIISGQQGQMIERKWMVTASEKHGMPTREDEKVYVALMRVTKDNEIDSPRQFFTRYRVLEIIGWPHTGTYYGRVESALDRLMGVTIKAENAFYDRLTGSYATESFHIIDNYRLWDHEGTRQQGQGFLPLSYFKWNEIIWRSIRNGYVKNLDTDFWFSLEGAVTRRLHRYLDKKFYQADVFKIGFYKLALEKLGLARNSRPAKLRGFINKACEELIEKGYLSSYEYADGRTHDPILVFRRRRQQKAAISQSSLSGSQLNAKRELVARGITPGAAEDLAMRFSEQRITEKIELYEHLKGVSSPLLAKNPAGYLRKAIEDDYSPPEGFLTRTEKAQRAETRQQADRQRQRQEIERQYQDWLSWTEEERVAGNLWRWKIRQKRELGREPASADVEAKKQELIAALPSPEEYRKMLFADFDSAEPQGDGKRPSKGQ